MICSPILLVGRSRSGDSCTYFSTAFTLLSSFDDGTGRFSQARNSPAMSLLRSKASRRPSFLITMYGISSMRSYEVKRRSHFRHSRRRRIASPSLDSRESTTLSSIKPQNGHFIRLLSLLCCRGKLYLVIWVTASSCLVFPAILIFSSST